MGKIDSAGTFIGEVLEMGVNLTSKSKYPQAVVRLKAAQKYIADAENMAHFGLTEPGYVPWIFEGQEAEEIIGYLVLFNSASEFNDDTKMLNYEQLQLALGWDGAGFDALADGTYVGKSVMFRVDNDTYDGKTQLKVNWIDNTNASPERALKTLDSSALKGLNALIKVSKTKTVAAPAKPAKPGKPAAAAPAASAPSAPAATASAVTAPAAAPAKTKAPKGKAPAAAPSTPPPAPVTAPVAETPALPTTITKDEAWAYVSNNKGTNDDTAVEDAWISATQEVGPDRNEDDFTGGDWAKVRDIVIKDLAL